MDDARRKFNVENTNGKATVIMCFNVAKEELASLNFQLSGENVTTWYCGLVQVPGHHDQQQHELSWCEDGPHAYAVTSDQRCDDAACTQCTQCQCAKSHALRRRQQSHESLLLQCRLHTPVAAVVERWVFVVPNLV